MFASMHGCGYERDEACESTRLILSKLSLSLSLRLVSLVCVTSFRISFCLLCFLLCRTTFVMAADNSDSAIAMQLAGMATTVSAREVQWQQLQKSTSEAIVQFFQRHPHTHPIVRKHNSLARLVIDDGLVVDVFAFMALMKESGTQTTALHTHFRWLARTMSFDLYNIGKGKKNGVAPSNLVRTVFKWSTRDEINRERMCIFMAEVVKPLTALHEEYAELKASVDAAMAAEAKAEAAFVPETDSDEIEDADSHDYGYAPTQIRDDIQDFATDSDTSSSSGAGVKRKRAPEDDGSNASPGFVTSKPPAGVEVSSLSSVTAPAVQPVMTPSAAIVALSSSSSSAVSTPAAAAIAAISSTPVDSLHPGGARVAPTSDAKADCGTGLGVRIGNIIYDARKDLQHRRVLQAASNVISAITLLAQSMEKPNAARLTSVDLQIVEGFIHDFRAHVLAQSGMAELFTRCSRHQQVASVTLLGAMQLLESRARSASLMCLFAAFCRYVQECAGVVARFDRVAAEHATLMKKLLWDCGILCTALCETNRAPVTVAPSTSLSQNRDGKSVLRVGVVSSAASASVAPAASAAVASNVHGRGREIAEEEEQLVETTAQRTILTHPHLHRSVEHIKTQTHLAAAVRVRMLWSLIQQPQQPPHKKAHIDISQE